MVNERTKDLKESEERFRFLAETIPALIWIVIPGSSWTVEYVNNNWTEYTGLSAEGINAGEWEALYTPMM